MLRVQLQVPLLRLIAPAVLFPLEFTCFLGSLPPDKCLLRNFPSPSPVILSAICFASRMFTPSCLLMICKLLPCIPQAKQMNILLLRLALRIEEIGEFEFWLPKSQIKEYVQGGRFKFLAERFYN